MRKVNLMVITSIVVISFVTGTYLVYAKASVPDNSKDVKIAVGKAATDASVKEDKAMDISVKEDKPADTSIKNKDKSTDTSVKNKGKSTDTSVNNDKVSKDEKTETSSDIGENMNGKSVTLKVGQTVKITLDSNATTGYSWSIVQAPDASVAVVLDPEYKAPQYNPDNPIFGQGGKDTFRLTAVHTGSTSLKLQYVRPWEKNNPASTFSLKVDVSQ